MFNNLTDQEQAFQSTLPVRGGTCKRASAVSTPTNFNPPSPCGEGLQRGRTGRGGSVISIHPPRAGRDVAAAHGTAAGHYFNPPSPCGEGRQRRGLLRAGYHFNPPSPCGEGHRSQSAAYRNGHFNPPSPCGEGRRSFSCRWLPALFQSTLPVRGGTVTTLGGPSAWMISIHPPRAGRDGDFMSFDQRKYIFQSTLPVRGGT